MPHIITTIPTTETPTPMPIWAATGRLSPPPPPPPPPSSAPPFVPPMPSPGTLLDAVTSPWSRSGRVAVEEVDDSAVERSVEDSVLLDGDDDDVVVGEGWSVMLK